MNKDSIVQQLRNKASELDIDYNRALSQFFFDEFLKRLSLSEHRERFMLKGGILLTYVLGIENRATQDMDFLVKDVNLQEKVLLELLEDIIESNDNQSVWFEMRDHVTTIRVDDKYGGLRFNLFGRLSNIRFPFSVDIATGDPVYPAPIVENYTTILGDQFQLTMYPLETVLAEKLQTILVRAENNTRSKDFYDIYILMKDYWYDIDKHSLKQSVLLTFRYRDTELYKEQALQLTDRILNNRGYNDRWQRYIVQNPYVGELTFVEVIRAVNQLIDDVF